MKYDSLPKDNKNLKKFIEELMDGEQKSKFLNNDVNEKSN